MKPRDRWIALFVSMIGIGVCFTALVGFISMMQSNDLPWLDGSRTVREHYLAVGNSYSQGFTTGFFLCLFLCTAAVAVGAWVEQRRARRRQVAEIRPIAGRRKTA